MMQVTPVIWRLYILIYEFVNSLMREGPEFGCRGQRVHQWELNTPEADLPP
jgi:hypothetical protein